MNVLVLGRGKTGSLVAEIAQQRGHDVTALGGDENTGAAALSRERLAHVDVVIDFTTPQAVLLNVAACAAAGKNMVVGTTGWYEHLVKVRELVEASGAGFVYAPNFSVGVNLFFDIVRAAAPALGHGFTGGIVERHHAQKKDAPSGTAIAMKKTLGADVEITSIRQGDTVGMHVLLLDSENDTIMLTHDAKSRRGFAEGAVRAAEWLAGKRGFHEFKDVLKEL